MSLSAISVLFLRLITAFVWIAFIDKCSGSADRVDEAMLSSEYCPFETFRPSCRWKNEVIVMKAARYGRMKLGRCVSESTKLGCSADVLEIVSRKCSGKRECEIRLPDSELDALKPCGEMWNYLEASYMCMKVVEDDRLCTVSVSSSEPVHIQAQTSTRCGSSGQPWQLEAPAGQRITVSVLDFAPGHPRSSNGPSHRRCRGRVYGFLVDKTQKTNVSVCETNYSAGALSGDTLQEEAQSSFSEGRAALVTSSNSAELLVVRDEQLANNFLVRVEATGCANIIPAEDAYLKRVDDHNVIVGCYETRQTWQLSCQGNQWTGTVGMCDPSTDRRHRGESNASTSPADSRQQSSETFRIVATIAVTSVGLAVCLMIICIGIYCLRRYPKKGENEGGKGPSHSTLINDSGRISTKAGLSQPVSGDTSNQFTHTGQYFVLEPEHTDA